MLHLLPEEVMAHVVTMLDSTDLRALWHTSPAMKVIVRRHTIAIMTSLFSG